MNETNLIERSWAVFEQMQRKQGISVDEVSFVGGFMTCFGMLTGRVDIGLSDDFTVLQRFERIQKELDAMRMTAIQAANDDRMRNGR